MCTNPKLGFPCGHCVECLQKLRHDWSLRLQYELFHCLDLGQLCYFATLTYSDDNVPHTIDLHLTLKKSDVQDFMKRFRRYLEYHYNFKGVKFYVCGEYGTNTFRPHYHISIYNFPKNVSFKEVIEKTWQKGFVLNPHELIPESCHYATKYMICVDLLPPWKCEPPFRLMSKGLGKSVTDFDFDFVQKFYGGVDPEIIYTLVKTISDVDLSLLKFYISRLDKRQDLKEKYPQFPWNVYDIVINTCRDYIVHNGRKFSLPRYWRTRIFPKEIRELLNIEKIRKAHKKRAEYNDKYSEYDRSHEVPMWKELACQKEEQVKKYINKKYKKDLKNDPKYL